MPYVEEEVKTFWGSIWGIEKQHNEDAEWLNDLEESDGNMSQQESFQLDQQKIKKQLSKLPRWKTCGSVELHGYWLKTFDSVHERISKHFHDCMDTEVPKWMATEERFLLSNMS